MSDNSTDFGTSAFASLVLSLSSTAWISLGKIADPITGKVKIDLVGARYSIDTLIMLRDKTKGNLTEDENKLLIGALGDLQANYAESVFTEKEKIKDKSEKKESEEKKTGVKEPEKRADEELKDEAGEVKNEVEKNNSSNEKMEDDINNKKQ